MSTNRNRSASERFSVCRQTPFAGTGLVEKLSRNSDVHLHQSFSTNPVPAKGVCLHTENLSLALLFRLVDTFRPIRNDFSFLSRAFISGLSSTFFILTIPLTSVRRKASGNMKPLLLAIFKFCTTNQLFKKKKLFKSKWKLMKRLSL